MLNPFCRSGSISTMVHNNDPVDYVALIYRSGLVLVLKISTLDSSSSSSSLSSSKGKDQAAKTTVELPSNLFFLSTYLLPWPSACRVCLWQSHECYPRDSGKSRPPARVGSCRNLGENDAHNNKFLTMICVFCKIRAKVHSYYGLALRTA